MKKRTILVNEKEFSTNEHANKIHNRQRQRYGSVAGRLRSERDEKTNEYDAIVMIDTHKASKGHFITPNKESIHAYMCCTKSVVSTRM